MNRRTWRWAKFCSTSKNWMRRWPSCARRWRLRPTTPGLMPCWPRRSTPRGSTAKPSRKCRRRPRPALNTRPMIRPRQFRTRSCLGLVFLLLLAPPLLANQRPADHSGHSSPAASHPVRTQGHDNILLITIDTLRADHLGCYGYKAVRTPTIDGLAREGVLFPMAISQVPLTLPSHAAILTGTYPFHNGLQDFTAPPLSDKFRTLAEAFPPRSRSRRSQPSHRFSLRQQTQTLT